MTIVKHRLPPTQSKVRADIELTCFNFEGIDAIKNALRAGEKAASEGGFAPIKVKLVAPPLFVIFCTAVQKDIALKSVEAGIEAIEKTILQSKGTFTLTVPPRLLQETEEKEFSSLLKKLSNQNEEISGDNDNSDDD
eukprot:TRINITY_DN3734_c0_g2_i2.p1 TRINITY_DN3734_c0_g2~~TRINITY_DN3734_c0_g2_i2.p1  ORF type:complete len:137 (-),score=63.84 TRINITY_DN3734_c0_g2_i2:149-559(-)